MKVHVGALAYNQENWIVEVRSDLARQDLFEQRGVSVQVFVRANGCTDDAARVARACIWSGPLCRPECSKVLALPFAGRTRTWNHFMHEVCLRRAGHAFCRNANIRVQKASRLGNMLQRLMATGTQAVNSRGNSAVLGRLRSAGRDFSDGSVLLRALAQNEGWLPAGVGAAFDAQVYVNGLVHMGLEEGAGY